MWYVVADSVVSTVENDPAIWTVSKSPTKPGWETFGGYPGFGLTKAHAQFLAAAANEKEFRKRAARARKKTVLVGWSGGPACAADCGCGR